MPFALILRRILTALLWLLLAAYVAACVFSIAIIFISSEALSGVYAVLLSEPWMFAVEALAPEGLWALLPTIGAMSLNAGLLYLCIRLVRPAR